MPRKPFVGGNWKCNGSRELFNRLIVDLNAAHVPKDVDVIVAPTNLHLFPIKKNLSDKYHLAAQNCGVASTGAYTGEIGAPMLKEVGVQWVILGHSERRQLFSADVTLDKSVKHAIDEGLKVVFCIGETLEQREKGKEVFLPHLQNQIKAVAEHLRDWSNVVLAYEPIWAIGTGRTASPEQAQDIHKELRGFITSHYGAKVGDNLRIIYGGSVSDKNCNELISKPDVDGFLVGGASLKGKVFPVIFQACSKETPRAKL